MAQFIIGYSNGKQQMSVLTLSSISIFIYHGTQQCMPSIFALPATKPTNQSTLYISSICSNHLQVISHQNKTQNATLTS
jgi:hypothetical protein